MGEPAYRDSSCSGSAPLVVGTALGRRTFYLDEGGIFRGVTYRAPWRDGENVAQCFVTKRIGPTFMAPSHWHSSVAPYYNGGVIFDADPDVEPKLATGHGWDRCEGLAPNCGCGFYAYHTAETQYAVSGPGCKCVGIIEAYGKLVLGDKGYRASKARIAAILIPPSTSASQRRQQVERSLHDCEEALAQMGGRPAFTAQGMVSLLMAAVALANAWVWSEHRAAWAVVSGYSALASVIKEYHNRAAFNSLRTSLVRDVELMRDTLRTMPDDYSEFFRKAQENYPSVRFYDDVNVMARDWPVESLAHLAHDNGAEATDG